MLLVFNKRAPLLLQCGTAAVGREKSVVTILGIVECTVQQGHIKGSEMSSRKFIFPFLKQYGVEFLPAFTTIRKRKKMESNFKFMYTYSSESVTGLCVMIM